MPDVLLLNMPWSRITQPRLGVSLLKAILQERCIETQVLYLNLRWAERLRRELSDLLPASLADTADHRKYWVRDVVCYQYTADLVSEWVFSQGIHGPGSLAADDYVHSVLPKRFSPEEIEVWLRVRSLTRSFLMECSQSIEWERYKLVGFTCYVAQTVAALGLARLVKERCPRLPVIFGGPNCQGLLGAALLRNFDCVDYVADGEADESFAEFCERIVGGGSGRGLPGILWREAGQVMGTGQARCVEDLDSLPSPDLSDFFEQRQQLHFDPPPEKRAVTFHSRGCWWGERKLCVFCGFDRPELRYRCRSGEKVAAEVMAVAARYQVGLVNFAESILDWRCLSSLVPALEKHTGCPGLFVECKSNLGRLQIRALRRAGFTLLQPGIEALSSHVLGLMKKGVTALQNVECLKWCKYYGIKVNWNLVYGIPGETPEDYEQSLRIARSIPHLSPPSNCSKVLLLRFSPLLEHAREYGFTNVRPRDSYPHIYDVPPEELTELAWSFDYDYVDGRQPDEYTAGLTAFAGQWQNAADGPLLHVPAGRGRGRVIDRRFNRVVDAVELDPFENRVYRLCESTASFGRLMRELSPAFGGPDLDARLRQALRRFEEYQVMVSEGDRYLSVALSEPEESGPDQEWLAVGAGAVPAGHEE